MQICVTQSALDTSNTVVSVMAITEQTAFVIAWRNLWWVASSYSIQHLVRLQHYSGVNKPKRYLKWCKHCVNL